MTGKKGRPAVLVAGDFRINRTQDSAIITLHSIGELYRQINNFVYLEVLGKVLEKLRITEFSDLLPSQLLKQSFFVKAFCTRTFQNLQSFTDLSFQREDFIKTTTGISELTESEADFLRKQIVELICKLQKLRANFLAVEQLHYYLKGAMEIVLLDAANYKAMKPALQEELRHNQTSIPSYDYRALICLQPFDDMDERCAAAELIGVVKPHHLPVFYNTANKLLLQDLSADSSFIPTDTIISYDTSYHFTDIGIAHLLFLSGASNFTKFSLEQPLLGACAIKPGAHDGVLNHLYFDSNSQLYLLDHTYRWWREAS